MNAKVPSQQDEDAKKGIGINNVRKRLELLYTNRYDLQVREDEEVFVVDLTVDLVRDLQQPAIRIEKSEISYA
jgi:sensor histidine kinase YesM